MVIDCNYELTTKVYFNPPDTFATMPIRFYRAGVSLIEQNLLLYKILLEQNLLIYNLLQEQNLLDAGGKLST